MSLQPISNRASTVSIVKETTEGVPAFPTSGADYLALQEGFQMTPNFEELDNAELRASIGRAKPRLGKEQPTFPFSHYLRHSGDPGVAPGYGRILEALFGGVSIAANNRELEAASTEKILKLDTGHGADFARGGFVLLEDPVNGFQIRPVHSVSGDDVTLGFALPAAPAAGVKAGRCVRYFPRNEGHPTLTAHLFRGNGGAKEMVAGLRPTDFSLDMNAGEAINASFGMSGTAYFFNHISVTTQVKLDFMDDADTRAATIAARVYKDPTDLASALQSAMNALGSTNQFEVEYDSVTGKFKFTSNGTTFSLLWNTGANAANSIGLLISANMAANQSGSLSYALANAIALAAPHTPALDDADYVVAKGMEILFGDGESQELLRPQSVSVQMTPSRKEIPDVTSESGVAGSVFTQREVTFSATILLQKYDAAKFSSYRQGAEKRVMIAAGEKSGGNWVPGKCFAMYFPNMTITSFQPSDDEGLATLQIEMAAFVDINGNGEFYLGFV